MIKIEDPINQLDSESDIFSLFRYTRYDGFIRYQFEFIEHTIKYHAIASLYHIALSWYYKSMVGCVINPVQSIQRMLFMIIIMEN